VKDVAAFHSRVWQSIEDLGTRCLTGTDAPKDPCGICDACCSDLAAAQRALFAVIYRHRPDKHAVCAYCGVPYPCPTMLDVADDNGLAIELEAP